MIYYEQGDYVKKWEKLSENEIKDIFAKSISKREVARKIGYKSRNDKEINLIIEKYNIDISHFNKYENLSGQIFGRLKVLEKDITLSEEKGYSIYKCQCSCAKQTICFIRANSLKTGHTQSCGCLAKELASLSNTINLRGQYINSILVIERSDFKNNNRHVYWKCKCYCGKNFIADGTELRQGKIISCGCYQQSKGEKKIKEILDNANVEYKTQYTFNSLKGKNRKLRFDFAIFEEGELKGLIEFQGAQHYNSINYFGGEEEFLKRQEYDLKKRKYCLENSIPLNLIKYDEKITEERVLNFYDTKRIKFKPYT